jgi:hypothetical protein
VSGQGTLGSAIRAQSGRSDRPRPPVVGHHAASGVRGRVGAAGAREHGCGWSGPTGPLPETLPFFSLFFQ